MIPNVQALKEFDLIWRFSDAKKYAQLSQSEFQRFHPLSEAESIKLWGQCVYPSTQHRDKHLTQLLDVQKLIQWPDCQSFSSATENEEKQIKKILAQEIQVSDSTNILFFWHAEVCVSTDWGLFLAHWDDFCYPSDDSNVIIIPEYEKAIIYREDRWHILPYKQGSTLFIKETAQPVIQPDR